MVILSSGAQQRAGGCRAWRCWAAFFLVSWGVSLAAEEVAGETPTGAVSAITGGALAEPEATAVVVTEPASGLPLSSAPGREAEREPQPAESQVPTPQPVITRAESVDLGEPLDAPMLPEPAPAAGVPAGAAVAGSPGEPRPERDSGTRKPLVMLGAEVPPGTSTRLAWSPIQSFEGIAAPIPVLVVHGARPGPSICLTAAVHGDELNGIEIVRRVLYNLDADKLAGTVIGVPIVNLQGFRRGSRYLPDRRDLNRFFPGDPTGSSAARIAHSFFQKVISHCSSLVDLHTGSFYRTNLPQLRANLSDPRVLAFSQGFDGTVVLHSVGAAGTLREAAVSAGIPAVTLEAGEPMRLQEREVAHGVKSVQSLLSKLGMVKRLGFRGEPEPVYYQSIWVRADQGGILFSEVGLGERVRRNKVLGTVTDPITNVRAEILAPYGGRVLGMALNQVVMPGFAAYRIGIEAAGDEIAPQVGPMDAPGTLHTSQAEGADEPQRAVAKPDFGGDEVGENSE